MLSSKNIKIGFVGLSHLGLVHSIGSAEKGFDVIAYDDNKSVILELSKQIINLEEPLLNKLLKKNNRKITFTNEIEHLIDCDIIYISKDVPTNSFGDSDLSTIWVLVDKVLSIINKNTNLIILCQVTPGFTRLVETKYKNHKIYYQVETLIFGEAMNRFLFPERLIIGLSDTKNRLDPIFKEYLSSFNSKVFEMNYESAELTKISINIFLVSSVTVTNILSEISEKIGADWETIKPALKKDKRIGKYSYINSGLGISGGNLERDLKSIIKIGKKNNSYIKTVETFIENSYRRKNWLYDILQDNNINIYHSTKFAILGLSYKENTDSVKNSPSLNLINKLKKYNVKVHDPMAQVSLPKSIIRTNNVNECISGSDILIIATPWKIYKKIKIKELRSLMKGKVIIDPYRVLKYQTLENNGYQVFSLGKKSYNKESCIVN